MHSIPTRLRQIAKQLVNKFNKHTPWTTQVMDSFREGFLTVKEMEDVLRKPVKKLTLREMLLHFYWFFRGVHMCDDEEVFVDRISQMNLGPNCELSFEGIN